MEKDGFSTRLRNLRREKNLSQTGLGKIINLHYTNIGRYEKGISRPSADILKRLADAFGVTTDFLMEGTPDSAAKARIDDRDLLRQFQEVKKLPDDEKVVVKKFLDAFLIKNKFLRELTSQ